MSTLELLFADLARQLRELEADGALKALREKVEAGEPQAWPAIIWFLRRAWAAGGLTTRTTVNLIERVKAATAKASQSGPAGFQ